MCNAWKQTSQKLNLWYRGILRFVSCAFFKGFYKAGNTILKKHVEIKDRHNFVKKL